MAQTEPAERTAEKTEYGYEADRAVLRSVFKSRRKHFGIMPVHKNIIEYLLVGIIECVIIIKCFG